MPITWLYSCISKSKNQTLPKKHEARFYEWNGAFWKFGQIRVISFRYPRWNPCTPSLHHVSPFEISPPTFYNFVPMISILAGALKNILSRRFSPFWARVGRVTGTKQLFCHGLIIRNLHQRFFWPSLVVIAHILLYLTSDDLWPPSGSSSFLVCNSGSFNHNKKAKAQSLPHLTSDDLHEGHHHPLPCLFASATLLTKFGSHRELFNIFDPRGSRGTACATPNIQNSHV